MFNKYGSLQVNKKQSSIHNYWFSFAYFFVLQFHHKINDIIIKHSVFFLLRCIISCFITPIEHPSPFHTVIFEFFSIRFWDKTFNFQLVIRMQWILSPAESEKNAPLLTVHIRVNAWAQLGICFTNGKMLHNWENASWLGKCFLYY